MVSYFGFPLQSTNGWHHCSHLCWGPRGPRLWRGSIWMFLKSHHSVLVFILASLGLSSSARDLSSRILTSIEFSIFQTFGYCCGFTFHWTIVLFCLIAEVSTSKYKSPSILTAPGPSFRQLQIFCWSIHPMPSLLKSGLRQVDSSGSIEATPSFINFRIFACLEGCLELLCPLELCRWTQEVSERCHEFGFAKRIGNLDN